MCHIVAMASTPSQPEEIHQKNEAVHGSGHIIDVNTPPSRTMQVALMFVALVLVVLRLDSTYFLGQYLWAEDGVIFMNQAQSPSALWLSYNGYLHLYERIIAFISSFFDLTIRPHIYLAGWTLSYLFLVGAVLFYAKALSIGFFWQLMIVTSIAIQPANGELFFNITNSQWMLGAALTIYALVPSPSTPGLLQLFFVCVASLTGPFSILLTPILALNAWFRGSFRRWAGLYLVIVGCALVQARFLLTSGRLFGAPMDLNWRDWVVGILGFLCFGVTTTSQYIAAVLFWLSTGFALWRGSKDLSIRGMTVFLFAAIAANLLASFYILKNIPLIMGGPTRYHWVPYTLILCAAFLAGSHQKLLGGLITGSFLFIAVTSFHGVHLANLQYKSFANFAKYKRVLIPIHPQGTEYPGWWIDGGAVSKAPPITEMPLDLSGSSVPNGEVRKSSEGWSIDLKESGVVLPVKAPVECGNASDVGLEMHMTRSAEGWTRLYFGTENSLSRWYPSGAVTAQFAFPNSPQGVPLSLLLLEAKGEVLIDRATLSCLP